MLWYFLKSVSPHWAIHGGFGYTDSSRVPSITSGFYEPMNVHRRSVISAIVTVKIFFCVLQFNALYASATL